MLGDAAEGGLFVDIYIYIFVSSSFFSQKPKKNLIVLFCVEFNEEPLQLEASITLHLGVTGVDGQTSIQVTDIATYRLNWPRGQFSEIIGLSNL